MTTKLRILKSQIKNNDFVEIVVDKVSYWVDINASIKDGEWCFEYHKNYEHPTHKKHVNPKNDTEAWWIRRLNCCKMQDNISRKDWNIYEEGTWKIVAQSKKVLKGVPVTYNINKKMYIFINKNQLCFITECLSYESVCEIYHNMFNNPLTTGVCQNEFTVFKNNNPFPLCEIDLNDTDNPFITRWFGDDDEMPENL